MQVLSEGPVRITKATIEGAWRRRASGKRLVLRDQECRGLALVVNATGMAWTFSYRSRGIDPITGKRAPNRYVTIGNPASHAPDEARIEANRLKASASAGGDPAAERAARHAAEQRRRAQTMGRLVDDYATALPRRPKLRGSGLPSPAHVAEEVAQVRAAMLMMAAADTPLAEINGATIRTMLAALADKPATARARFGALSRFFDWCQDEERIASNPCSTLPKARRPRAIAARAHVVLLTDLAQLWRAADTLAPMARDLARLLIVVPCRRGEAARLDWSHLDLAGGVWTMPGALTKNGDPHRLHLPPMALAILQARYAGAGCPRAGLVFPAPRSGRSVDTFSVIKTALDAASGVAGWRWHDLRRSFATALAEAGTPEPVADAILNHRQTATRGGVLGVYQRASRWPEQIEAMRLWDRMLTSAITGNVVPLHPQQRAAIPA